MSCYKEGGNNFFAKSKIVGYWSIESLSVDGADSTANIKANPNYCEYPIIFWKEGFERNDPPTIGSECVIITSNIYWYLQEHKKQIFLDFNKGDSHSTELPPLIFNKSMQVTWNIKRLKNEEMCLQTDLNGKVYFVKLYKKKPL